MPLHQAGDGVCSEVHVERLQIAEDSLFKGVRIGCA
jgi:hypothetical protein